MIDVLIKLLEKLIELAKHRKEVEEKPFDLLISPLYSDLETVHCDYLSLFESLHNKLKSDNQLEIIAKQLMADRLEQEPLRRSISAFAESYRSYPQLSHYKSFLDYVNGYFYGVDIIDDPRRTDGFYILQAMECFLSEEVETNRPFTEEGLREELAKRTQYTLTRIRNYWTEISKEYAKLNVKRATS